MYTWRVLAYIRNAFNHPIAHIHNSHLNWVIVSCMLLRKHSHLPTANAKPRNSCSPVVLTGLSFLWVSQTFGIINKDAFKEMRRVELIFLKMVHVLYIAPVCGESTGQGRGRSLCIQRRFEFAPNSSGGIAFPMGYNCTVLTHWIWAQV